MEDNLDFGINWDPSSDFDEVTIRKELELISSETKAGTKKLSVHELRRANLELLASLIKDADLEGINDFYETNPSFPLRNKTYSFSNIALDNFNIPMIDFLIKKGLSFPDYQAHQKILEAKSLSMLDYFVARSKKRNEDKHNDAFVSLLETRLESIHPDLRSGYKTRLLFKFDNDWRYLYTSLFKEKNDAFSMNAVKLLDEKHPELRDYCLSGGLLLEIFNQKPKKGDWRRDYISRVPLDQYRNFFVEYFSDISKFVTGSSFSLTDMSYLVSFLKENKSIMKVWNQAQKEMSGNYKNWKDWYDKYIPENEPLEDSLFVKQMPNLYYDDKYSGSLSVFLYKTAQSKSTFGFDFINENTYYDSVTNKLTWKFSSKFALSDNISLRLYPPSEFLLARYDSLLDKDPSSKNKIPQPPKYCSPSFAHTIVGSASSILLSMLKKDDSRLVIEKCFDNPYTAYFFAKNASPDMLVSVTQAIPSLVNNKYMNGYSLAHLNVAIRADKTKGSMLKLLSVSLDWFLDKNDAGASIIDTFRQNGVDKDALNLIEHKVLKMAIKNDTTVGQKIRSRTKFSSAKRKM